jgi:pimeloyl-ACP methyl ester carboxylesterase
MPTDQTIALHGVTGHARTWDAESEALASRYRVIALDQRGHGDSDPSPDRDDSVMSMAGDLAAFVGALGLKTITVATAPERFNTEEFLDSQ